VHFRINFYAGICKEIRIDDKPIGLRTASPMIINGL
jgi:hypothetical protein